MNGSRRGDFSRLTFDPASHYSGVLMQQGRVQLDADWNEQVDIVAHRLRAQALDFVGPNGAPAGSSGFEIVPQASLRFDGKKRYLSLGHSACESYGASSFLDIEARIRTEPGSAGGVLFCRFDRIITDGPLQYSYMLSVLPDGRLHLHRHGGSRALISDQRVTEGHWSRVSLGHNRREYRLAIDGQPAGALDQGFVRDSQGAFFLVGLANLDSDEPPGFNGRLSEIRLSGEARPAGGEETLGWWRFERGGDVLLDLSGRGNHAVLGGGKREAQPSLELDDVLISAGRYYAGGVLCENTLAVPLGDQPGLPGLELPTERDPGRTYLFYLDVWERYIAPAQQPTLLEPALGGADTAGRTSIVAQTRWLPVELDRMSEDPDSEIAEWMGLLSSSRPSGRLQVRRRPSSAGRLENRLYRIEIQNAGGRYGGPGPLGLDETSGPDNWYQVEAVLPAVQQVILAEWPEGSHELRPNDWVEIANDQGEPASAPGLLASVYAVDRSQRSVTLATPLDSIDGQGGLSLQRLASFKWSRDNASIAVPVAAIEEGSRTVSLMPSRAGSVDFSHGDWVEIADDQSILEGAAPALHRVSSVSPETQTLTLDRPAEGVVGRRADLHPMAVRWDGCAAIRGHGWQPLEHGIEARFDSAPANAPTKATHFRPGDHWMFSARASSGTIDWPADALGQPQAVAPHGVDHHLSPLAVLRFEEWGFELRDSRPVFEPLSTGAVSKAGDRMHGPLVIRPRQGRAGSPGSTGNTESTGDTGDRARGAPALSVSGVAEADTLLGALGSPGAVETFALADSAVTRSKISPDVGTVPIGHAILGDSAVAPEGYEATGASMVVPNPEPRWISRGETSIGEEPAELQSVAIHGQVFTFSDSGRTWSYDPLSGVLEERQPMPEARIRFAAAAVHGKAYLIGGIDSGGARSGETLEYDPGSDAWSWRQAMPTPRSDLALAVADGKIFAAGGLRDLWFFEVVSRRNEVYDPLIDDWTPRRAMPTARYALSAAGTSRGLFAFGGRRRWFLNWLGRAVSAINEEYLPAVDRWTRRPNAMPAPWSDGRAAVIGDTIFTVGGRSLFGWSPDSSSFSPLSDSWASAASLGVPAISPGVAAVDGVLVVHTAGSTPGTLAVHECRVSSSFHVHRKTREPEGDIEPQLRIPEPELDELGDFELRRPKALQPEGGG